MYHVIKENPLGLLRFNSSQHRVKSKALVDPEYHGENYCVFTGLYSLGWVAFLCLRIFIHNVDMAMGRLNLNSWAPR